MTEREKQKVSLPESFFVIATHYPEDPQEDQEGRPIPPEAISDMRVGPLAV